MISLPGSDKPETMRDPVTQTVVDNIHHLLGERPVSWLQNQVNPTSSSVSDFLSNRKGKIGSSVRVDTLARIAEALDVPLTAFFVPPDRLDYLLGILRIVSSSEQIDLDQAFDLARELAKYASGTTPKREGGAGNPSDH